MARRLSIKEQALRPVIEDATAAVVGLADATHRVLAGDKASAGEVYAAARMRFNRAAETAAAVFGSWPALPDLRLMPYRAVLLRILTSTRMLVDAIPFLPGPHAADARRAAEIVDLVQRHLAHDLELLEDLPAAARRQDLFHKACDRNERHDRVWHEMIRPLRDEIAAFVPNS